MIVHSSHLSFSSPHTENSKGKMNKRLKRTPAEIPIKVLFSSKNGSKEGKKTFRKEIKNIIMSSLTPKTLT